MVLQEEILCYVGVSNINTANIKDQTYDEIDESLRETAWCVFGSDHFLAFCGGFCARPPQDAGVKNAPRTKCPVVQQSLPSALV